MKNAVYIMLIAVVVLLAPFAYRNYEMGKTLPGEEIYYHLRAASSRGAADNLTERSFYLSNFDYLLKATAFLHINIAILSIVLAALSCFFLYLLAIRLGLSKKSSFYGLIVFILSPAFIFSFSTVSSEIFSLSLIILGSYLLLGKRTSYFSLIPFALAVKDIFTILIVAAILLAHWRIQREKYPKFIVVPAVFALYSFLYFFLTKSMLFVNFSSSSLNLFGQLFSDIGGYYGISVFSAIFAIAGFFFSRKRIYFYPIILVLIVSFFMNYPTLVYSTVIVSFSAGFGLEKITKKKWKLPMLKEIMIYMLACGILLSAVSQGNLVAKMQPSAKLINAAEWLEKNTENGSVIFSMESYSYFIEYFGNRNVMVDPLSKYSRDFAALSNDSKAIFRSRNLEATENLLKKYKIMYILIDQDMLKEIWKEPDDGLLFLFTNQEKFATVYNRDGVKIIYYTGDT